MTRPTKLAKPRRKSRERARDLPATKTPTEAVREAREAIRDFHHAGAEFMAEVNELVGETREAVDFVKRVGTFFGKAAEAISASRKQR